MKRHLIVWIAITTGLLALLAACASPPPPEPTPTATLAPTATPTPLAVGGVDVAWGAVKMPEGEVVARVNGVEISAQKYLEELHRQLVFYTLQYQLDWNDQETLSYLPQIQENILQQLIGTELLWQLAAKEGISVREEDVDAELLDIKEGVLSEGQYKTWEEFLAANELTEEVARGLIKDTLLVELMTKTHGGPTEEEQAHALHILVADEETGREVLAKLAAGGSFEELAREYSIDPGSKDQGGDLGWFPRGVMVPEFEEVVFSIEVGKDSDLVQTSYGYHIIRVLEREVRPLEGDALAEKQRAAFSAWYYAEREKADIETLLTLDVE